MTAAHKQNYDDSDVQAHSKDATEFLTILIAGQRFGIPILQVQDVLGQQKVTTIPLAPAAVAGSLNLRGRIVTAVDLRTRLGITANAQDNRNMGVVVEHEHELYSLVIDKVGDVMALSAQNFEKNPPTLDPMWKDISTGIYRLEGELLVILDIPKLLNSIGSK